MSLTDYVIMPGADYKDACDAVREKTGGTELIKSGQMGGLIRGISGGGGGETVKAICEGTDIELESADVEFVANAAFMASRLADRFTKMDFPNAKSVGSSAFYNLDYLKSVNLPQVEIVEAEAFYGCERLENAFIPSAAEIGQSAFNACSALVSIGEPTVTSVGSKAFANCMKLQKINLSKNITNIPSEAFYNCRELVFNDLSYVEIIGAKAFTACNKLTNLELGRIRAMDTEAFSECSELETFSAFTTGLSEIRDGVFARCRKLNSALFRLEVESIGESAFIECESLTTLGPFRDHSHMEPLTIGASAFEGCKLLPDETVKYLTKNLEIVNERAFFGCASITKVDLPKATEVLTGAFYNCSSLTAVILRNTETVCVVDLTAFSNTPLMSLQGFLYVPTSMYEAYREMYEFALEYAFGVPGVFDMLFRKIEDYPEICG